MSNRDRDSRVDEMVWSTDIPGPVSLPSSSADSDEDDTELATGKPTGPAEAAAAVTMFDEPDLSNMPSNWCAISVNVTDDGTTMFVSRRQRNRPPVIFTLPLDRQGKREEEDECFTLETALTELRQIIADSDASARSAKDVDRTDRTAKTQWWSRRKELDKRLKDLLDTIEFCWLGAFKVSTSLVASRCRSTTDHHHPVIDHLQPGRRTIAQSTCRLPQDP
jgi:separase